MNGINKAKLSIKVADCYRPFQQSGYIGLFKQP